MAQLDTLSLAARLDEIESRLKFVMESTTITMNIPSGVLDSQGRPQLTQITGNLLTFYTKARQHGKSLLGQLTPDDFRDVIESAKSQSLAGGAGTSRS